MSLFDAQAIQRAVDAELATVPTGHTRCLVGYYTLDGTFRLCYAQRLADHWTFGAVFQRDTDAGQIQGGVVIKGSW